MDFVQTFITVAAGFTLLVGLVIIAWLVVHITRYYRNPQVNFPSTLKWLLGIIIVEIATIVIGMFSGFADRYLEDTYFVYVNDPSAKTEIWEDIHGTYYAYNDPWTLEATNFERYTEIHRERYEKATVDDSYNFMFFIDDATADPIVGKSKGFDAFHRFTMFQAKIHLDKISDQITVNTSPKEFVGMYNEAYPTYDMMPKTLRFINVRIVQGKAPALSFFSGKKGDRPYSIIYLSKTEDIDTKQVSNLFYTPNRYLAQHLRTIWERNGSVSAIPGKQMFQYYIQIAKTLNL